MTHLELLPRHEWRLVNPNNQLQSLFLKYQPTESLNVTMYCYFHVVPHTLVHAYTADVTTFLGWLRKSLTGALTTLVCQVEEPSSGSYDIITNMVMW